MEAPNENWFSTSPVASEEMFENVDDGRRRPTNPISSQMSLRLRWAKKSLLILQIGKTFKIEIAKYYKSFIPSQESELRAHTWLFDKTAQLRSI